MVFFSNYSVLSVAAFIASIIVVTQFVDILISYDLVKELDLSGISNKIAGIFTII